MGTPSLNLDRNMPILIVDDLAMVRRVVKNCLRQLGFENVVEAATAADAQACLEQNSCSLIITDWQLENPTVEGADPGAPLSWRSVVDSATIPVLLIGAEAQRKVLEAELGTAADNEALDYLVKPFTAQILEEKIVTLCAKESNV